MTRYLLLLMLAGVVGWAAVLYYPAALQIFGYSWAEGFIDHIVRWRYFPFKKDGVMVEVGAADPDFLSIGKHFRRRGWKVISIEPNPVFAEKHRAAGNTIYQVACSDYEEDGAAFQVVDTLGHPEITNESYSAIKVLDEYKNVDREAFDRTITKEISVNIRRLDTVLNDANVAHIDLLSVDVEGWELSVMRGLTLNPTVVILENWLRSDEYVRYMEGRGYKFCFRRFPNDVYKLQRLSRSRLLDTTHLPDRGPKTCPNCAILAREEDHVAFLCYHEHGDRPTTIHICDSNSPGAFKVYRRRAGGPA